MSSPDLTVALATRDRTDLLVQTLHGFAAVAPAPLRWEMVVVDDGEGSGTDRALEPLRERLPLVLLRTGGGEGKNAALNLAVERASGRIVAFVDDDVVPGPGWFDALMRGVARWPHHDVFGGRITPRVPYEAPPHVDLTFPLVRWALAVTDDLEEGPTLPERVWGPSMAVRRSVLETHRFDPARGPRTGDYLPGGEVELVRRVSDASGVPPVHLPGWSVEHVIRPEQLSEAWLTDRVFRMGRENAVRTGRRGRLLVAGVPARLYGEAAANTFLAWVNRGRPAAALKSRLWAAWARGAIHQLRETGRTS